MKLLADPNCTVCGGTGLDVRDHVDAVRYMSVRRNGRNIGYVCRCARVEGVAAGN